MPSFAGSSECKAFIANNGGKTLLVKFKGIIEKWPEKKLIKNRALVKKFISSCKSKGASPYYCMSNKKKENYCIIDRLNTMIAIEGIKRKRTVSKKPIKLKIPVIDKTEVGLGKLLLKSNYKKINQSYLAYYNIKKGFHPGVDYRAAKFTRVTSPVDGVIHSIDEKVWGRMTIKTKEGRLFVLLHMSEFSKKSGAVKKGEYLGKTGDVGAPGAPHLHVEFRTGGTTSAPYFKVPQEYLKYPEKTPKNKINTGVNIDPVLVIK